MTARAKSAVDVFLVAGFLGSGKTSLIRRLLRNPDLADTALIINEFGEVGLDQFFVRTAVENTLLLENGCVCCSIRGDLFDTITELFVRADNGEIPTFSRIIIETTGLADPGPIVAELRQLESTLRPVRLRKVIVTVDGVLGPQQIRSTDEAIAQVAQADLCLVTKVHFAGPNAVNRLAEDLRAMNPAARVEVVHDNSFESLRILDPEERNALPTRTKQAEPEALHHRSTRHRAVASWSIDVAEPIVWGRFREWLDLLYSLRAAHIVRMKALLNLSGYLFPVAIHGVGPLVTPPEPLEGWPEGRPLSRVVVITRDMNIEIVERSFESLVTAWTRASGDVRAARTASGRSA